MIALVDHRIRVLRREHSELVERLTRERDEARAEVEKERAYADASNQDAIAAEAKLARCVEALEPFIRRHCGLCVPVDEQGRMGEVTTESCVCDADQKQARAALAAAKGESDGA